MDSRQLSDWTPILTGEGGTVLDLCAVVVPSGEVNILALTPVGIFRSVDGATSWRRLSDATQPPLPLSMAVGQASAGEPAVILVGSTVGLFRFEGETGRWIQLLSGEVVTNIGLSPSAPAQAPVFAATEQSGLLVSSDLGSSWTESSVGLNEDPIVALSVSPRYPTDQTLFVATATDLYRSRNGGKAWRRLDFEPGPGAIQCLNVSADNDSGLKLYVGHANGLSVSADLGVNWTEVNEFAGVSVWDVSVTPGMLGWNAVTVLTDAGCYSADDSSDTWRFCATADIEAISSLSIPNSSAPILVIGTAKDGIYRGGRTDGSWIEANAGLEAIHRTQIQTVESSLGGIDHLIVNEVDNGLLMSSDVGNQWTMIDSPPSGGLDWTVIQASREPDTLLTITGSQGHKFRISAGMWERIAPLPSGRSPVGFTSLGQVQPGGIIAVAADGSVWRYESDGGWADRGKPFGSEPVVAAEFIASCRQSASVWAIVYTTRRSHSAPIPTLWRSVDAGQTWSFWLESSSPGALAVAGTVENRHEIVYVGTHNQIHRMTVVLDQRPDTLSPEQITRHELDNDLLITSIALSPRLRDDRTLFLGTNRGVWISRDEGKTYSHWVPGGPTQITALTLGSDHRGGQYVVALELGGTVWARRQ